MIHIKLEKIHKKIQNCKKCRLWNVGKFAVPGEGPNDADVMLVGQNPGKKEAKTGRPFVGRSGTYLNKILEKNEIDRKKLFITNTVKHKTPDNRKPYDDEIETCLPYLEKQIEIINPKIVVLLGKVAENVPRKKDIKYIETYHPAAAMRFNKYREKFEKDFEKLTKILKEMGL